MTRRFFVFAGAALALTACASTRPHDDARVPARGFISERIGIATRGKGPDVILIPGLTSHRDVWAGVAAMLEDRYRLHLVQVNGFAGFAAGANADGPVAAPVAEEIARYIREQGLERPAGIRPFMGGSIGLMLGTRPPHTPRRPMGGGMPPIPGTVFGPPGGPAGNGGP